MLNFRCVIGRLCVAKKEYHLINPTTQVALFSLCIGHCPQVVNIQWSIYSGIINSTSQMVQWTLFNQINQYQNIWVFGNYSFSVRFLNSRDLFSGWNTNNFTSTNDLFVVYPSIEYWRFEVVYSFERETSLSALNLMINRPPENGSCSINPLNGTITTLFTILCSNWQDKDGIQDYIFYSMFSHLIMKDDLNDEFELKVGKRMSMKE